MVMCIACKITTKPTFIPHVRLSDNQKQHVADIFVRKQNKIETNQTFLIDNVETSLV